MLKLGRLKNKNLDLETTVRDDKETSRRSKGSHTLDVAAMVSASRLLQLYDLKNISSTGVMMLETGPKAFKEGSE